MDREDPGCHEPVEGESRRSDSYLPRRFTTLVSHFGRTERTHQPCVPGADLFFRIHNDHRLQCPPMRRRTRRRSLFTSLPLDVLLRIFYYCDFFDILNFSVVSASQFSRKHWSHLSQTCVQLRNAVDEHQVWLHQVERLQIPIPPGTTPSKKEL